MGANVVAKGGFTVTKNVAKGSLGATRLGKEVVHGATGLISKKRDKVEQQDDEECQQYNPEDLQSRRKKSPSLLERVSDEHFAAQQAAHAIGSGGTNPFRHDEAHSLVVPEAITTPQLGSWDVH
jgi:hypothetical protein